MKRLLILFSLLTTLSSFSLYAQKDKGQKAIMIREKVQNKNYVINCDRMYPLRGQSKYVGSEYSIKMKGDSVYSYLPYIGVVHSTNYNGNNVLDFKQVYTDYTYKEGKKKTLLISFIVENENERLKYNLTFYPNGNVRVYIQPTKRDAISYSGEVDLEDLKK